MGTVTLSKQNRLFWLGRYNERVYTTLQFMLEQYDHCIDSGEVNYGAFCRAMGIPCSYENSTDFCQRYLFDENDPNSIISSMEAILGNGMVLRETITTPTLAYLQMARTAMDLASRSESPSIELQWVLDDLMAFRGSFDDAVEEEGVRNITKAGSCVERVSLMLRLNWRTERLEKELRKLLNRLYKTDLPVEEKARDTIIHRAMDGAEVERFTLLRSVEGLFLV